MWEKKKNNFKWKIVNWKRYELESLSKEYTLNKKSKKNIHMKKEVQLNNYQQ